jgi:radical SAM superfamily enzyme YgiQ (UPF0313 family)
MNKEREICLTSPRLAITDIDALPFPDRSLIDYTGYVRYIGQAMVKNSISLYSSRGCPYHCKYCDAVWPKKQVTRSAENLFEELKKYYDIGVRRYAIIDDIFNLDIKNSARFFKLLIDNHMDVKIFFPAGLRGDILTYDYIDLMVEAGCAGFALALETPEARLQKLIGKNLNIDRLLKNTEYICSNHPGVILEFFTMHGFPTESEAEALHTLEVVRSFKWLHFPYLNLLRIYANTGMEKIALENGISLAAIKRSETLAWHEISETLPFAKTFTYKCQSDLLHNYILAKDRLLHVLPYQMQVLTEDEMVQKYNSYLPGEIKCFDDILKFCGIEAEELKTQKCADEESLTVTGLKKKLKEISPGKPGPAADALRILLLDISQPFTREAGGLYDCVEEPLGLLYLLSYLYREFAGGVDGKICKSRIDFDSYEELKELIERFEPHLIGIRTLSYYKKFFHRTVALIREWGIDIPVIAGGPYATRSYGQVLADSGVNLAVVGEGEISLTQLVSEMKKNDRTLPDEEILRKISGIAFVPAAIKADEHVTGEQIGILTLFNEDLENE